MSMPKATMYKDDLVQPWKHEVGSSWQVSDMQPKSVSHRVRHFSHKLLRSSIFSFHSPHPLTSRFYAEGIGHGNMMAAMIPAREAAPAKAVLLTRPKARKQPGRRRILAS